MTSENLLKLEGEESTGICPNSSSCYKSFWLSISSDGVFTLVDQGITAGDDNCNLFLAYAINGSGSLAVAGIAASHQISWSPKGMLVRYDKTKGNITVKVGRCTRRFIVDPKSLIAGSRPSMTFTASPPRPGSAVVEYVGVSPSSCPVNSCFTAGYYIAWDVSGSSWEFLPCPFPVE